MLKQSLDFLSFQLIEKRQPLLGYLQLLRHNLKMSNKYSKLSNQLANELEAKILSHIQSKIESIVIEKVSELLAVSLNEEKETEEQISNELKVTKLEVLKLNQDISRLIEKTDFMLGSVAYLSEEYDYLNKILKSMGYQ